MTLQSRIAVDPHTQAPSYQTQASASIEAEMDFLAPMSERPYHYTFEPPPGEVRTNAIYAPHRVPIHDLRPLAPGLSLDREGFALIDSESAVADFYDEDELRRVYYPEAERIVAEATGGARVVIFDHTIRQRVPGLEDRTKEGPRQPALRVHNDYTVRSGPQRVRDLMGAEAEALLRRRFAVVNLWRPIKGPLRDAPLAVCDAGSVAFRDLVAFGSDLSRPPRRDLHGEPQSRPALVLRAGDATGRSAVAEMLQLGARRHGAVCPARCVRGSDCVGGRPAAREHRAADIGVLPAIGGFASGMPGAHTRAVPRNRAVTLTALP